MSDASPKDPGRSQIRNRLFGRRPSRGADGLEDPFDEAFLQQLELLEVVARRIVSGRQRAERRTQKVGSGLEFADYRPYSAGDDVRDVDWNVLVRLNEALVREYEEDEDLPVRVVVDASSSMMTRGGAKLRHAMRIGAALAYVALANLDRVGVEVTAADKLETLPAVRGKGRIFRVFDFLRNAPRGGKTDIRASCNRVAARATQPGVTVVLSDFYDLEGAFEGLNLLRFRKHQPVAIQILDPVEADPRNSGLRGDVALLDTEGGPARDVTLTPAALGAYAEAHERFCQALESNCRSRGIPYFRAPLDIPLDDLVLKIFRFGGVLR